MNTNILKHLAVLIFCSPHFIYAHSVTDITDLVLVTGQSNVRASETQYNPSIDSVNVRVFAYTNSTDWEVADLHQKWDVDGWHPGNGSIQDPDRLPYNNFAFHFAKTIVENDPNRVVGFVVASAPGEGILHWDAGSPFFQTLETHVVAALNAQGVKAELDGILWHQGETDWQYNGTSDPDATTAEKSHPTYYPEKLDSLIQRFRNQPWFGPNKPFICGETKQAPVNGRLMEINTDSDPWTACVQGSDLTTKEMDLTASPPKLGTHFDAESLRTLGQRYAIKYLAMTPNNKVNDTESPIVSIDPIGTTTPGSVTFSGESSDDIAIDRNKLLIRNTSSGKYWNGAAWTTDWAWVDPTGNTTWSYDLTLPAGNFIATAWTWDTSNNLGNIVTVQFYVDGADNTPPAVSIDTFGTLAPGDITISGTSHDNTAIDRNKLLIRNLESGNYWTGSSWTTDWSWFDPLGLDDWSYLLTLPAGDFRTTAWTWDTSNNLDIDTADFTINSADTIAPTVNIVGPTAISQVSTGDIFIYLSSSDEIAIDRNKLLVRNLQTGLYWNGSNWVTDWSWFAPGSGTLEDAYEAMLIIDEGLYELIAWTWDSSNNVSNYDREVITVSF